MNKNELYKLLAETEKQADKAEIKRIIITVIGYAIGICYVFCLLGDVTGFANIAGMFLISIFTSGILLLINSVVYHWLFESRRIERERIEDIKKQISELQAKDRDEQIKKEIAERYKKD